MSNPITLYAMLRRFLVISFMALLSSCKMYQEIDYRKNKKEKYTRACGYTFFSGYYESEDRIVINVCTPKSCDYYAQFQPVDCDKNMEIESVEAFFVNTQQNLILDSVEDGTLRRFKLPDLKSAVKKNNELSVKIKYKNLESGEAGESTYLMRKKNSIYFVGTGDH